MRGKLNPEIVEARTDTPERYLAPSIFSPPLSNARGHSPFHSRGKREPAGTNKHPSGSVHAWRLSGHFPENAPTQRRIAVAGATRAIGAAVARLVFMRTF